MQLASVYHQYFPCRVSFCFLPVISNCEKRRRASHHLNLYLPYAGRRCLWRKKGSQHVHSAVETVTSLTSAWGTSVTAPWIRYAETSYGGRYSYNGVAKVHNFLAVVSILAATVFYQIIVTQVLQYMYHCSILRLVVTS